MINIINILESEIKGFRFYSSFVFDKFLYKLCLIGVTKIDKESGTVCSHEDVDDLMKNVPRTQQIYVIDKGLQHTDELLINLEKLNMFVAYYRCFH